MDINLHKLSLSAFIGFTAFALALKGLLDLVVWRYAGPISLAIVLVCVSLYLTRRGKGFDKIGLVRFKAARSYWLPSLQTVIAFVAIVATGALVIIVGDASGLAFMQAEREGALSRFGDLAGNTPLFCFGLPSFGLRGQRKSCFSAGL